MTAIARVGARAGRQTAARAAVRASTLPSGLRVVTERVPGALSVAAGVWVGVGSRDEPADQAGVSHFLEHLLFKGTEALSARSIAEAIDRTGGDMNAFTAKEYTSYYVRLPLGSLDLGLSLLGDVIGAPALRTADIESERQVILEELGADEDSPEDRVHTLVYESLFPGHPLGGETAGRKDTVAALAPEQVRSFFATWYRPENIVVAVAGAVDHGDVLDAVRRTFTAVERRVGPNGGRPLRIRPGDTTVPLAVARRRTEQVHLAVGFRGVPRRDPDREALDVVNHVLGGGMSSRLFEDIREERGLAYAVYSSPASYADAGSLVVYAGTSPATAEVVLDLIVDQLGQLCRDGITDAELDVAQGYLAGSYVLGLEDTGSRMARLGGLLVTTGELRTVEEQVERWLAVSHDDVRRVIGRVLAAPRALAVVGPLPKRVFTRFAGSGGGSRNNGGR